jgi:predicted RNase H-like HicB family nuclease
MDKQLADSLTVPVDGRASMTYTRLFTQGDDGWICAQIVEVPEAISQGRTFEEARANVIEALEGALDWRLREREPIPKSGQVTLSPVTVSAR